MSSEKIEIVSHMFPALTLRSIEEADIESLRFYKNKFKDFFFHKDDIDHVQQMEWFRNYLQRSDDFMFIVEEEIHGELFHLGSMGFRIMAGVADIYNVLRWDRVAGGRARMGDALRMMCSFIRRRFEDKIGCKVLINNPAKEWYAKIGYRVSKAHDDYLELVVDDQEFVYIEIDWRRT